MCQVKELVLLGVEFIGGNKSSDNNEFRFWFCMHAIYFCRFLLHSSYRLVSSFFILFLCNLVIELGIFHQFFSIKKKKLPTVSNASRIVTKLSCICFIFYLDSISCHSFALTELMRGKGMFNSKIH